MDNFNAWNSCIESFFTTLVVLESMITHYFVEICTSTYEFHVLESSIDLYPLSKGLLYNQHTQPSAHSWPDCSTVIQLPHWPHKAQGSSFHSVLSCYYLGRAKNYEDQTLTFFIIVVHNYNKEFHLCLWHTVQYNISRWIRMIAFNLSR